MSVDNFDIMMNMKDMNGVLIGTRQLLLGTIEASSPEEALQKAFMSETTFNFNHINEHEGEIKVVFSISAGRRSRPSPQESVTWEEEWACEVCGVPLPINSSGDSYCRTCRRGEREGDL